MRRAIYVVGQAVRETGQAMDRLGMVLQGNMAYKEQSKPRLGLCGRRNPRRRDVVEMLLEMDPEAYSLVRGSRS